MKKSIFNMVLLSMLFILGACSSESNEPDVNFNSGNKIVNESEFVIPAISTVHGRAGISSFTIPEGFADVTSKVSVSFHNKDNEINEKKAAINEAMRNINAISKGLEVHSVGDFKMDGNADYNGNGNIEVTFKPAPGYKFESGSPLRKVIIHLKGAFIDTKQTIEEIPFNTTAREKKRGQAGVSSIQFDKNFKVRNIPIITFNTSSLDAKKIEAIKGIEEMFLLENKPLWGASLPEGVRYTKGNVKIKKEANGNDKWGETHAWVEVTFDVNDVDYIFPGGGTRKKIDIQINILHI